MARSAKAAAMKKNIAGEIDTPRYKKLEEIAKRTQRTRADIISTVVKNWLDSVKVEEFKTHPTLIPPEEARA
jgi:hypothetical protein